MNFAPGHYEVVEDGAPWPTGTRTRLTEQGSEQVSVVRLTRSATFTPHEFRRLFRWLPDGEARYAAELQAAVQGLNDTAAHLLDLQQRTQHTHTHLGLNAAGELQGQEALLDLAAPDVGALVPVGTPLMSARRHTLSLSSKMTELQEQAQAHKRQIEALSAEALSAATALIKPLERHINKLKETVWTLELYAGSNESLTQILSGAPASQDAPVTVRQGVLSMAEESAVLLDERGMDADDIDLFDEWLRERPERIDLLLPEPKGVVGLVARWDQKSTGEPWLDAAKAKDNRLTHLLIRNGQQVFRVKADLTSGRTLLPTRREFLDLFQVPRRGADGEWTTETLTAGSPEFLKAQDKAEQKERHYYRVALILQGIVDRTAVLQPLPEDSAGERRINFTAPGDYLSGRVQVIEDVGMALDDPREQFSVWQARVNRDMEVGRRVVGDFSAYGGGTFADGTGYGGRRPVYNARFFPLGTSRPPRGEPITIEAKKGDAFVARYARTDVVAKYDRAGRFDGHGAAEVRASVRIYPEDLSVLLLDHPDVTAQQMREFLARRTERHLYLSMIPLLKEAIRVKEREAQQEEPFIRLLARYSRSACALDEAAADLHARRTVASYKYKYKTHRALPVGDPATFDACCALADQLYGEQQTHAQREASGLYARFRQTIEQQHGPDVLWAGVRGPELHVFLAERPDEHIYAQHLTYQLKGEHLRLKRAERWTTLTLHWKQVYPLLSQPRWTKWHFHPNTSGYPTGPQWEAFVGDQLARHDPDEALLLTQGYTAERYVRVKGDQVRGEITHLRRTPKGEAVTNVYHGPPQSWRSNVGWGSAGTAGLLLWEPGAVVHHQYRTRQRVGTAQILRQDVSVCAALEQAAQDQQTQAQHKGAQQAAVQRVLIHLEQQWTALMWARAKAQFLRDYGADAAHLWEGHQKIIRADPFEPHPLLRWHGHDGTLRPALFRLAAQGPFTPGQTLRDALEGFPDEQARLEGDPLAEFTCWPEEHP